MSFVPVAAGGGQRNGSRERLRQVHSQHANKLHLILNALATRVIISDGVATGVEFVRGKGLYSSSGASGATEAPTKTQTITARNEVILAGGVFNTPQLLKLSGIGPRDELEKFGIDVIVDAPGVGANLHDRYEVSVNFELDADYPLFEGSTLDIPHKGQEEDALFKEWQSDRSGPFSTNGSLAAIVASTSATDDARSDVILFSLPVDFHGYYPGYAREGAAFHNRLSILVLKGYTRNRAGSVTLRSASPIDALQIAFRYFDEGSEGWDRDLDGVVEGVEMARKLVKHLEVASVARELNPGPQVQTRDQLREFVKSEAWGHHACGTAKIGVDSDPMAVLDSDFRVRGVERLRVVDASVFPDIPGFFIASAVYMISEKAADVILEQRG